MKPQKKPSPSVAARPSLPELTAAWARAKSMESMGKREADAKRDEILEAGAEVGYEDDSLAITETSRVDLEDKRLEKVLREVEAYDDVLETKISATKVRALAELNPRVARVVALVTKKTPRFEQVAKKGA